MATGPNTVPVGEPVFAPKAVLTKNPRPAHTRQWPEERARTNLVKADQLKIEYDFEACAPGKRVVYDERNDFGFQAGLWRKAEQKRFEKIVSDYSLEVNPIPRWTDYKEMVQELRAEELPERGSRSGFVCWAGTGFSKSRMIGSSCSLQMQRTTIFMTCP